MMLVTCGFEHVVGVLNINECNNFLNRIASIESAGTRLLLKESWCASLAQLLRDRVSRSIPELNDLVAVGCNYFHKSQRSNWFVAFHQDRSVPILPSRRAEQSPGWSQKEGLNFVYADEQLLQRSIGIRLHIDDSTPNNGPLRVIPKSHNAGVLCPNEISAVVREQPEEVLTAAQGDVVAMRPLLLHASSKATDSSPRRVLHFIFCPVTPPLGLEWRYSI